MKWTFIVALVVGLSGCSSDDRRSVDSGAGGMDAGGGDTDAGAGDTDAGGGDTDAGGGDDAGGGGTDAGMFVPSAAAEFFCDGYEASCMYGAGMYADRNDCLMRYDAMDTTMQLCVANALGTGDCASANGGGTCAP